MAIVRIKNKGLREIFEFGKTAKINKEHHQNIVYILDFLDAVHNVEDCEGVKDFHPLKGQRKDQYSMHVNGNMVITFRWIGPDIEVIDFEDYH